MRGRQRRICRETPEFCHVWTASTTFTLSRDGCQANLDSGAFHKEMTNRPFSLQDVTRPVEIVQTSRADHQSGLILNFTKGFGQFRR
jgi:hypothetical protein